MSQLSSRKLDEILRIYKNANEDVLAIDKISIHVEHTPLRDKKTFHTSIDSKAITRKLFHLVSGASRVVAIIQMIGKYSSLEDNGGNFLRLQYTEQSANIMEVNLEGKVALIGDNL